jgi:hemolysin III
VRAGIDVFRGSSEVSDAVAPRLRGWLHVAGALGVVALTPALLARATTTPQRVGVICFALGVGAMFSVSALLHRGRWSEDARRAWRRADQVGIVAAIVGTNLAVGLVVLHPRARAVMVIAVAAAGILAVVLSLGRKRLSAPRWTRTAPHLLLGWAAIALGPAMWHDGGPTVTALVIGGGLAYSLGAVAYATRRPRLAPATFGFHELFHAATLAGAGLHALALWVALR